MPSLLELPTEILTLIAVLLWSDGDLSNYRASCRRLRAATALEVVLPGRLREWYDPIRPAKPVTRIGQSLANLYKLRSLLLFVFAPPDRVILSVKATKLFQFFTDYRFVGLSSWLYSTRSITRGYGPPDLYYDILAPIVVEVSGTLSTSRNHQILKSLVRDSNIIFQKRHQGMSLRPDIRNAMKTILLPWYINIPGRLDSQNFWVCQGVVHSKQRFLTMIGPDERLQMHQLFDLNTVTSHIAFWHHHCTAKTRNASDIYDTHLRHIFFGEHPTLPKRILSGHCRPRKHWQGVTAVLPSDVLEALSFTNVTHEQYAEPDQAKVTGIFDQLEFGRRLCRDDIVDDQFREFFRCRPDNAIDYEIGGSEHGTPFKGIARIKPMGVGLSYVPLCNYICMIRAVPHARLGAEAVDSESSSISILQGVSDPSGAMPSTYSKYLSWDREEHIPSVSNLIMGHKRYLFEGIIFPGGTIMMGRWFQERPDGSEDYFDVDQYEGHIPVDEPDIWRGAWIMFNNENPHLSLFDETRRRLVASLPKKAPPPNLPLPPIPTHQPPSAPTGN